MTITKMRDLLRDQHRAIDDGITARDPAAAADARPEISLRRIRGGRLSSRESGQGGGRSGPERR